MTKQPLLDIYCVAWNEEKILPDFINWYRSRVPGCLITVYDNMSTDRTFQIALENECKVIAFDTNGKMDEQTLMDIRNSCWKESEAKWCLVVDADELVDITENFLEMESRGDIYQCEGYEMFGTEEDTIDTLLYGCKSVGYCKPILFRPAVFSTLDLHPGSHGAHPITKDGTGVRWVLHAPNLYHTKWRSWTNGIERAKILAQKRSEHSKKMSWNFHYQLNDEIHRDYYMNGMRDRIKVR